MRVANRTTIAVMTAGLLIATSGTGALSSEGQCRQLEDLARQYTGVKLTSDQQRLKRKLVSWYNENCRAARTRQARR